MRTEVGRSQVEIQQYALSSEVGEELGRGGRGGRRGGGRGGGEGGEGGEGGGRRRRRKRRTTLIKSNLTTLTWQVGNERNSESMEENEQNTETQPIPSRACSKLAVSPYPRTNFICHNRLKAFGFRRMLTL